MAGDPQTYTAIYVTMNNKLLAEEAAVTINKKSGGNSVFTVAKGFAGIAPGAPVMEMTIDSAAPSADFEVNPDPYLITNVWVEVGAVMSGRQMTGKMFVLESDYSHAVNQESKVVIKLIGPCKPWE